MTSDALQQSFSPLHVTLKVHGRLKFPEKVPAISAAVNTRRRESRFSKRRSISSRGQIDVFAVDIEKRRRVRRHIASCEAFLPLSWKAEENSVASASFRLHPVCQLGQDRPLADPLFAALATDVWPVAMRVQRRS